MALIISDRVKETTNTTGTGTYTLAGALPSYESFAAIGNGNTTYYACTDGTDWEVGIGTYTASGTTLARTTILQSSNSDAAVNWGSGIKTIFCTLPADKYVFKDADGDVSIADDLYVSNKIVHTGDTDAYIGFPSDDTWQVVTGNSSAIIANNSTVTLGRDINSPHDAIFTGNVDAAQFRSQADTGYYLDPDGDSILNNLSLTSLTVTSGTEQLTFDNSTGPNISIDVAGTSVTNLNFINDTTSATILTLTESGNLTVAGTIEGRDIAADGTKLDNIEAGATADQTASEIKTAYESNADTNAFTDTLLSKLNNIEAGATADQTKADIDALGIDAATLDSIDSTSFLRSDVNDTATGNITFSGVIYNDAIVGNTDNTKSVVLTASGTTNLHDLNLDGNLTIAGTVDGRDVSVDGTKLDTIEENADVTDTTNVVAALTAGTNITIAANGTISSTDTNTTYTAGTGITLTGTEFSVTNPFTDADETKLDNIEEGATADQTAAEIKTAYESNADTNAFTDALLTKLNNIEANATADQTKADIDALGINAATLDGIDSTSFLRSDADDTGTNLTLSSLTVTAGTDKVVFDNSSGPNIGVRATGTGVTNLTFINNSTSTDILTLTESGNLTVAGTIDGRNVATDGTKLDGIESGATADQTAAEIKTAYESNADTNAFTDTLLTKLNNIEANATADQTAAEIRALVEAATDSNVFTDADHTKLNNIEAGATADQTAAEIRALVEAATDSNVFTDADHSKLDGIETGATADQTKSDIDALGINADQVDGLEASQFLRSDANDTATGNVTFSGVIYNDVIIGNTDNTKNIVLTAAGTSSLNNLNLGGNLTVDGNTTLESSLRPNQKNITSSATTVINLNEANHFVITMTQNTTLSLSNIATNIGSSGNIVFIQDATGGYSFTLDSNMKTPVNGATIVQSTGANEISILSYHVLSGSQVLVNYIGDFA